MISNRHLLMIYAQSLLFFPSHFVSLFRGEERVRAHNELNKIRKSFNKRIVYIWQSFIHVIEAEKKENQVLQPNQSFHVPRYSVCTIRLFEIYGF